MCIIFYITHTNDTHINYTNIEYNYACLHYNAMITGHLILKRRKKYNTRSMTPIIVKNKKQKNKKTSTH